MTEITTENLLEIMDENPVNPVKLHDMALSMNIVDIAEAFEFLAREQVIQVFRFLPKSMAADVFSYLDPLDQQTIVEDLTDAEIGKIIGELFADDAVDFIEEMPANVVKRVLRNVSEDKRQLINQLLQYPEDSAGSIMTVEFIDLKEEMTVAAAFDRIRRTGVNKETIYTCFVVRRDRVLAGVVTVKDLLLSEQNALIGDIMDKNIIFAHTTDDQEAIAALFTKYGMLSLPIVDKEERLVGIVTIDDVVQIIEEEATEDFELMAAITPSEDPYLKTSVLTHSRNRVGWLMFLMITATITAAIMDKYEEALIALPVLYVFVPMLMDTGGNAGSQSATMIIRGIAVGEIKTKNVLTVLWREVRIGFLCAIMLGAVNFMRVYLMNGQDYMLCAAVTLSLIATIMLAKTTGCLLPLLAHKLKIDPAIMAAPLITTIVDSASLIIYFAIAQAILHI